MNKYFKIKVKYQKVLEDGREKVVTEPYLVDAVSLTDSEAVINRELEPFISGEFLAFDSKVSNIAEVIPSDTADKWHQCKVAFITRNEESGNEKRSNSFILVQADNVSDAYDIITKAFSDSVSDYEIPEIKESDIVDVISATEDDDTEA